MDTRLIRFTKGPKSRRSIFVNDFLVKCLGKTRKELELAAKGWGEVNTSKYGLISLERFLNMPGQTFDEMLFWVTNDFKFFSWDDKGRLTLTPENLELCILFDRLLHNE